MSNSTTPIELPQPDGLDISSLSIVLGVLVFYLLLVLSYMTKGKCCAYLCCCFLCERSSRTLPLTRPPTPPRSFLVEPENVSTPRTAWVYITTPRGGNVILGRALKAIE